VGGAAAEVGGGAVGVLTTAGIRGGFVVALAGGELACVTATLGVGVPPGIDNVLAVALGVAVKTTTPTISSTTKATPTTMSARLIDGGTER
jgi:hypothetical protein